eukprot:scaffold571732_cov39-Prasinocladus_malaysianus.AAC.1
MSGKKLIADLVYIFSEHLTRKIDSPGHCCRMIGPSEAADACRPLLQGLGPAARDDRAGAPRLPQAPNGPPRVAALPARGAGAMGDRSGARDRRPPRRMGAPGPPPLPPLAVQPKQTNGLFHTAA